jgi:uncharacterized protein (TIGR00369 family)
MTNKLNPEYIKELIQWVNASPFPQHLSMKLTSVEPDRAELTLDIHSSHFQVFNLVHGGVLATLIDTATYWAVFGSLPEDAGLVNVELKLNYLQPVTRGPLSACGECIRAGRTLSYAEARVCDARGEICAHGTSTLMTLPGKGVRLKNDKFIKG